MSKILIMRHGSVGASDGLSYSGRVEVAGNGHKILAHYQDTPYVYSSPRNRCIETANIVGGILSKKVQVLPTVHDVIGEDDMKRELGSKWENDKQPMELTYLCIFQKAIQSLHLIILYGLDMLNKQRLIGIMEKRDDITLA